MCACVPPTTLEMNLSSFSAALNFAGSRAMEDPGRVDAAFHCHNFPPFSEPEGLT